MKESDLPKKWEWLVERDALAEFEMASSYIDDVESITAYVYWDGTITVGACDLEMTYRVAYPEDVERIIELMAASIREWYQAFGSKP